VSTFIHGLNKNKKSQLSAEQCVFSAWRNCPTER